MNKPLKRQKKKISLYHALSIGYLRNERKQAKRLKKFGYKLDPELTTGEHLVAYNPEKNKVIYVSNGSETGIIRNPSQFIKDWSANLIAIPTNTFEHTKRFQREKDALTKAKEKYKEAKVVLVGHSQSGQTLNLLADNNTKAIALNPALLKQKPNPNLTNYRIKGDPVSAFANDIKELPNPKHLGSGFVEAHAIENVKNQPIFV